LHADRSECHCRDAGLKKVLEAKEEQLLLEDGRDNSNESSCLLATSDPESMARRWALPKPERMEKTKGMWAKVGDVPRQP